MDLEEECDPPSFIAGQKKLKIQQVGIAWLMVYVMPLRHHVTVMSLITSLHFPSEVSSFKIEHSFVYFSWNRSWPGSSMNIKVCLVKNWKKT